MERVYTMEKPPTTLEGWMRAASLFDEIGDAHARSRIGTRVEA
jgi:hypothetical protein